MLYLFSSEFRSGAGSGCGRRRRPDRQRLLGRLHVDVKVLRSRPQLVSVPGTNSNFKLDIVEHRERRVSWEHVKDNQGPVEDNKDDDTAI